MQEEIDKKAKESKEPKFESTDEALDSISSHLAERAFEIKKNYAVEETELTGDELKAAKEKVMKDKKEKEKLM